jgi:hypothetical protein
MNIESHIYLSTRRVSRAKLRVSNSSMALYTCRVSFVWTEMEVIGPCEGQRSARWHNLYLWFAGTSLSVSRPVILRVWVKEWRPNMVHSIHQIRLGDSGPGLARDINYVGRFYCSTFEYR